MLNIMLTSATWGLHYIIIALPILIFCLLCKPNLSRTLPAFIAGGLMVVASFVPMYGMPHEVFLIVWMIALLVLLVLHTAAWAIAIVKKMPAFLPGAVLTGLAIGIPCAILGNFLALAASIIYIMVLIFKGQDLTCPV